MARRVLTAREQHEMLSPWRTAGTYWHITDHPDFKPDPSFRPENNGTMGGHFSPGLFVSQHPDHWMQSYGYWRPYMSEIDVPDEVGEDFQNSPERFITPDQYDKIKVKRTIPVDAYAREQYGESGWVEGSHGEDFETGEKFTDFAPGSRDLHKKTPGYKYPGTAMDQPEEWRKNYEKKVRDYQQRTPGIIAGRAERYKEMPAETPNLMMPIEEMMGYANDHTGLEHHHGPLTHRNLPHPDTRPEELEDIKRSGVIKRPLLLNVMGDQAQLDDGHHRLSIADHLGMSHVPVYVWQLTGDEAPDVLSDAWRPRHAKPIGETLRNYLQQQAGA